MIMNILKEYHDSLLLDNIGVPGDAYYSLQDTDNLNEILFSRHLRKSLLVS